MPEPAANPHQAQRLERVIAGREIAATDDELRQALEAANLPTIDLSDAGRTFLRFDIGGDLVGFGGYERHGGDVLMRSLVVVPERRGQGLGAAVANEVLRRAAEAGGTTAYLLTTTAEDFFEHLGFRRIARAEAPPSILATKQAATICASATMLMRTITSARHAGDMEDE